MKKGIKSLIKQFDYWTSQLYSRLHFEEKRSLMIFFFHALVRDQNELGSNVICPTQAITIQYFRQFVEYYLNQDYIFISPDNILNGLNNDKKYILITFDDGYFNNQYALPILEEYKIPAVFFIAANYVKYNRCFWWDVLYRERIKQGMSFKDILIETQHLKIKTNEEIEKYVNNLFGERAFKPICDIDRPFVASELKEFLKEKFVFIGNHTSDHAILTNYSPAGIKTQILSAQNTIYGITGITPIIISYPNGNYSAEVIKISKEIGLRLGLTADFKKNYLPIDIQNNGCMQLGRFYLDGEHNLIRQCELFRSDIRLMSIIKSLKSLK